VTDEKEISKLHEKRAECSEREAAIAKFKDGAPFGGMWWRMFDWFERQFRKERHKVEDRLGEMGYQVRRYDE
jgi:hypothetical protein